MLPGAKIGWDKVTGRSYRLVARKNSIDPSSGVYSAELGRNDGMATLSWNSSVAYWSSGEWNGRFFSLVPEMSGQSGPSLCNYTYVKNDREVYFSYTLLDENMIVHDVVDVSGQKKMRIWTGQDWITVSNLPKNPCDVYAACGPFTVCTGNADPPCSCMKGFSIRSPDDWGHEDRTGGCIRNTPLNCGVNSNNRTGMTDQFYSLLSIRLPENGKGMVNATNAHECANTCLRDCSCTAYSYSKGGCSIWHDGLTNVATDSNGETLYLRLAAKEVQSSRRNKTGMTIGVAIGASTALLVLIVLMITSKRRRKWSSRTVNNDEGVGIISFRYVDLQHATKNFSDKLGGGSFGSVFKGYLSDSVVVAVKRLDGACQGEKQFRAEVSSIGIIQNVNLVKLVGFCCEGDKRLLVYEHMPNRSLDAHLFRNHDSVLNWTIRYQIALGVARGLAYLHHGCRDCIIHCDIKPENILLDVSFVPKIADFGMAKFIGRNFSRAVTTMRGTMGYLAPEWISGMAITSKVDVYSYGMLLLEIISGSRNSGEVSSSDSGDVRYFPVHVAHKLLEGDVGSLVDANVNGDVKLEEVERLCKVACWCIQDNDFARPTMGEVVQFLEGVCEPDIPPVPRLLNAIAGGSYLTNP
ncbi:hypothetical protein ACP4OV_011695 [Aristida adscensionis]